ncbi:AraC family transcriptional regulator [Microvirga puerhi]|uniref:AraC family transcriptional regulator n=1 Tax=Microvirga puerhi TaxID=2876078 RepID=A0ABS7VR49_9HYPH|nr:AraC family transcriptional regulator [Microvirga puerhi]MBZ6077427.1 AraC family transcriptional regulator [Microvirga puerhi]
MNSPASGKKQPAPASYEGLPDPTAARSLLADLTYRTSKVDELENVLCNTLGEHKFTPLSRDGQFDGAFWLHGTWDFSVFGMRFGRSMATDLIYEDADDRVGFTFAEAGSGGLHIDAKDLTVAGYEAAVFTSGPPRRLNFGENSRFTAIVMSQSKIMQLCAKLLGREVNHSLGFTARFDLATPNGKSWLRLFQYAVTELGTPESPVRHLLPSLQQLEQMLMTGLLFNHRHNYTDALLLPQSAAAPFHVRRAEAFIEAHFTAPLSLADIAAHAGVSARSLQSGFQNFRGMTPMAFLRSVRLRHARQALLAANPQTTTVTEIALTCGYNHLGEFATAYKRTFGVTPSQTLLTKA